VLSVKSLKAYPLGACSTVTFAAIFNYLCGDLKPLKILQINNRIPWPLNDGGNLATYYVGKFLSSLGHKISLAALNTNKHRQDPKVVEHVYKVYAQEIDTSIRLLPLVKGLFSKMPYNISRFVSPEFSKLLKDCIAKEQPDVIQFGGSYQAIFIQAVREVTNAPIVLRSHNVEWKIWQRLAKGTSNPLKRWYLNNLQKKIRAFETNSMHEFDAIIAITEEDRKWYEQSGYKKKLQTIQAGVDLSQRVPSSNWTNLKSIGFIGSLEWEPNIEGLNWFVEEVWPAVFRNEPEARFHVAGKNPPEWMNTWEVPGMTFHGMVDDATEFIKQAHLFIVPLMSGSGMRLKVIEAMAMKKCVVSTSIGAEGIQLENGKDIILADDAEEMTSILLDLLRTPEKSKAIAEQGYTTAIQNYDWNQLIHQFVDVYQGLL